MTAEEYTIRKQLDKSSQDNPSLKELFFLRDINDLERTENEVHLVGINFCCS